MRESVDNSMASNVAVALHGSGQQTSETVRTVAKLEAHLGLKLCVTPGWGTLAVRDISNDKLKLFEVTPANVAMNRVAAIEQVVEGVVSGRQSLPSAATALAKACSVTPIANHYFAVACGTGAASLSFTFGMAHVAAVAIIFALAFVGGYLRRFLSAYGANAFTQAFAAALLAGAIGAGATKWGISSDLHLIAVCPCMILVPGPHLLNGTLDLLANRIPLGTSRLIFAALVLASICAGLLVGFAAFGTTLPPAPAARSVSILPVLLAAGAAAASYSAFFSLPPRLLGWPILAATVADTARWAAMTWLHAGPVVGAGLAALLAGLALVPVARRQHVPFAGIGFASIVSLMPGLLVFRMAGGIIDLTTARTMDADAILQAIVADGATAFGVIFAMTIGIILPKLAYDAIDRSRRREVGA